jgi:hypothetical protein
MPLQRCLRVEALFRWLIQIFIPVTWRFGAKHALDACCWRLLRLVAAKVLQMAGGPGNRARKGVRAFAKGSSVRYASVLSRYAKTTTMHKKNKPPEKMLELL